MKVTLRQRKLAGNKSRLFLDFYPAVKDPKTGKEGRWENLKLFLFDAPGDENERKHNRETFKLAKSICAKRQLMLQQRYHGIDETGTRPENFSVYFRDIAALKKGSNRHNWDCAYRYFIQFTKTPAAFDELTIKFCEEYKNYLLGKPKLRTKRRGIEHNSALSYFAKFRAVLRQAWREKLLQENLYEFIPALREKETYVEHLTMEEVGRLVKAPVKDLLSRRAILFAILTGVRFSDVQGLLWSQVRGTEGNYSLQFRQRKTGTIVYMPVSDQAFGLMERKDEREGRVFAGLNYNRTRDVLKEWAGNAGIRKHLNFNCLRHTYATLQLDQGTDIYTVSKMLGHRHLKTTLRYTKVMDKKKRETTDRIVLDL